MAEVPDVFNQDRVAFVLLPEGIKFPPIEKGWQEKGHSFHEATTHKGNVGILAGNGFIGLDQDDPSAFKGLELPTSTEWQTRPGRFGMWFRVSDDVADALAGIGKKPDQAQLKLFKAGKPCGEVKLQRTYQVIPPSWKTLEDGSKADYKLLHNVPPAEIRLVDLLEGLQAIGIAFSSKLDSNAKKLEEMGKEDHQRRAESDEARSRRYALAALKGEVKAMESSNEGNRNEQLNKSVFALGQFVGAGVLSEAEVVRALSKAAMYAGLEMEEIRATIKSGLEAGAKHPRDIPEPEKRRQEATGGEPEGLTVIDAIKALDGVCDHATTKDGAGFSKFDREEHGRLIDKAISEGYLPPKEEKTAYRFIKKYKKQLKTLGIEFNDIGHITRDGEAVDDGLAKINDRIPVWIADHHFKTVADTERLYRYDHGVYLDDGEIILKTLIENEFSDITSNRLVQDVIGKVKRRTYIDRDAFNSKNILNVKNGQLDLETLELGPHTPDYLSTAQIDVVYDPTAKAPNTRKFWREIAKAEDIPLIEEITGWMLWPDYNVHKAVMFLGPGRNGKGTLLRQLTAFLGKKSISNVTLQDLVADRFAKADLYGKLANIGGDLPSKDLSDTAAFRNLTGGDDNRAQEKYRASFNFRNKAKMLFSANVLPRSPDDTYAFYSRWIIMEFLNIFDLQKGTADPNLDTKLQTPEELSGLLNIALTGLKRLKANGWRFSYDKTVEDVEIMYKRNSNPVLAFLMDECDAEPSSYIEKTVFNNRFNDYAKAHNIRPLSTTGFGKLLKDQTEIPVSDYRPHFDNRTAAPRCWLGVKFKEVVYKQDKETDSSEPESIPSIVPPTPSLRENESESKEIEEKKRGDRDKPNRGRCGRNDTTNEQAAVKVRFRTDYRTDLNSTMHDLKEGAEIEVVRWRAEAWQKRGIVDIVEASG